MHAGPQEVLQGLLLVTVLTLSFVSSVKERINSAYVALRVLKEKSLILLSFL